MNAAELGNKPASEMTYRQRCELVAAVQAYSHKVAAVFIARESREASDAT